MRLVDDNEIEGVEVSQTKSEQLSDREPIDAQELSRISESREEERFAGECEGRDRAYRHERELLQVTARKALRIAERLVKFQRPLVAAGKVSQPFEFCPHCQTEAEGENPQLLKQRVNLATVVPAT
jgi:hypothetical protein